MPRLLPLLIASAMLAAMSAGAVPAGDMCAVTAKGTTVEGPCDFSPRKGGSFSIQMADGWLMGGAKVLALDLAEGGAWVSGTAVDGAVVQWGAAQRDPADTACWAGEDFRLCARAAIQPASARHGAAASGAPVRFTGRCHMMGCSWVEQTGAHQIGEGSAAVPGRLMAVRQRWAYTEHPNADYPAQVPADVSWNPASEAWYFCSTVRPALRMEDGSWTVLPLPEVFGATEAITSAYLHVCHPDKAGGDPYEAVKGLGYKGGGPAVGASYADFEALIGR